MRWGAAVAVVGLALLGVALAVAALAGRTDEAAPRAGGGLGSWTPPADAPAFCTDLAGAEHLDRIPVAVGRLAADPADADQARELALGSEDVREVRDAVREEGGHRELEALLDGLAEALTVASSGPLVAGTTERIGDGLLAVGDYVQPLCEFPT